MSEVQTVHLFNCDKTYKFNTVETWLEKERSKQGFSVQQHYFSLPKILEISNETIPGLNMDVAVFVVHAHDSYWSIDEENGYTRICRALLQKTGDNVIIVIGGDDKYRNEDEESKEFISRWAKRKVPSEFKDEYIDGRKGFILSWNKEHREIHEEALRHFLDPSKRGTKFEYKRNLPSRPESEKTQRCQVLGSELSSSSGAVQDFGANSHEETFSGLRETHGKSIDVVILGCHISEESMHITEEVFRSLCSSLRIESHISKNCSPVEAKVCLEKNVARFCVLLVDGETVNDAYATLTDRIREYEDLLKTAANRVAEKVIVLIFKPCSLPTGKDEILVSQSIESTLGATGKGHVLCVEDYPTKVKSRRIREKMINLIPSLKSQLYSNDSIPRIEFQHSSNVTERTVHNTLKSCRAAHPPQHTTEHRAYRKDAYQSQQSTSLQPRPQRANQDFSSMKGFVMLRSRLEYGRQSNDVEIHYPGFIVPKWIETEMYEKYRTIYKVVVEIISDGKGGYTWSPSANKSLVQLGANETVMLKTRLCKRRISIQPGHLEFIYPGWEIPKYIIDDLMKQYHLCSDGKLYIISNEKKELRLVVRKAGFFSRTYSE